MDKEFRSTTIIAVRRDGKLVMGGDGQVSLGDTVLKQGANKVRKIYEGRVLAGFAGSTADAFTLLERFEAKLKDFSGNLTKAAVELAKEWRTDKFLRRLEAMLIVADAHKTLLISGNGDVIEPDEEVIAIGSGGQYALAAAKGLFRHTKMSAREIVETAMKIASEICVYTNDRVVIEEL